MAVDRLTSTDILAVNSSEELVGLILETAEEFPEIAHFVATHIAKTTYKTLVETALPSVAFRADNTGRETQSSTLVSREVACKFLDASWDLDEKVAKECEWGVDAACALQAKAHLRAALMHICSQTWYGTAADSGGFAGIASLHDGLSDDRTVNAGGTTASTGSSVFAVRFGIEHVCYAWGSGGQISEGERKYLQLRDASGDPFWGYAQPITGHVGLQITDQTATGRIANLTADSGKGLTDSLLSQLFQEFGVGKKPHAFFASRRSVGQLHRSRTATTTTGKEADWPTSWQNVPIIETDAIVDAEALLT